MFGLPPLLSPLSLLSFYRFFLLFLSKQFQTFPLLPKSILSPLFPTSLLPLSPLLWFSDVLSRLIHVHSLGAEPLRAAALCSVVNHLTSSNQKRANCVSQGIPANTSPGDGKRVEKKSGRERVCLPCMCVFWNKANTLCAIFKPHCRAAEDSIFWTNRVYFKASKISICSIKSVLIEEMWNCAINNGIIVVSYGILM